MPYYTIPFAKSKAFFLFFFRFFKICVTESQKTTKKQGDIKQNAQYRLAKMWSDQNPHFFPRSRHKALRMISAGNTERESDIVTKSSRAVSGTVRKTSPPR